MQVEGLMSSTESKASQLSAITVLSLHPGDLEQHGSFSGRRVLLSWEKRAKKVGMTLTVSHRKMIQTRKEVSDVGVTDMQWLIAHQ